MSFDLHISFTGMCLFVPDPEAGLLDVILPTVPCHCARVFYDVGYEVNGDKLYNEFRRVPLAGLIPLPQGLVSSSASLNLPRPNLLDISLAESGGGVGFPVDPAVLSGTGDRRVHCHIVLSSGFLLGYSASTPYLRNPPSNLPYVTWKVEWLVPGVESSELIIGTGAGDSGSQPVLHPVNGVIEIRIKNVMDSESTAEDPPYAAGADIFSHVPEYGKLTKPPRDFRAPAGKVDILGSLVTCAVAIGERAPSSTTVAKRKSSKSPYRSGRR